MDKGIKRDWSWLPAQMPRVAALVAEHKRGLGDAHVSECWQRGVVKGEPGWFYAKQGSLAVGTPWPEIADAVMAVLQDGQAMVWLRPPGGVHATH